MFAYVNFPSWIRPEIVSFLPIRWYGVMYVVAFAITHLLLVYQCKRGALGYMSTDKCEDLSIFVVLGLIICARVFSCLVYEGNNYYWTHPWMIFWPFRNGKFIGLPGMSYHGGVIGAILGGWIFARKNHYRLLDLSDTMIAGIPLGYTFGRLGNFINGELWGRVTGSSYGMIFPAAPRLSTELEWVRNAADKAGIPYTVGDWVNLPRYPSQLYEALGEGLLIFAIIWFLIKPVSDKKKFGPGLVSGSYFILYGLVRFIIEFFREPDVQLGFVFLSFSMGQILCFLMILAGVCMLIYSFKSQPTVYSVRKNKKHDNKRKN